MHVAFGAIFTFDMCARAYICLKTQKITKGRLFHARVTVDHEINLELGELFGLTPGALFHAKIWRETMCARLTRVVKLIYG